MAEASAYLDERYGGALGISKPPASRPETIDRLRSCLVADGPG